MIVCSQNLRAEAEEIQNGSQSSQYNGLTCRQKIGKKKQISSNKKRPRLQQQYSFFRHDYRGPEKQP